MRDMTLRRFGWALRARGCTVSAWPAAERDPALRLLASSESARLMLADAMAAENEEEAADPAALHRIQGAVRRALSPPPPVVRGIRWGAIAACVAAGLYLGLPAMEADPSAALGPTMQASTPAIILAGLD